VALQKSVDGANLGGVKAILKGMLAKKGVQNAPITRRGKKRRYPAYSLCRAHQAADRSGVGDQIQD
jgi:hypothetical protein